MLTPKSLILPSALLLAGTVRAHGVVQSWTVNGERKAGFNPAYPPDYGPTAERPTDNADWGFADFTQGIVACGGNSPGQAVQTWDLDAGSTVTAHWHSWPDSHKGPAMEYMARCPGTSCDGVAADSLDWFKISEHSWDGSEWPGDKISRELDWRFTIPGDLAPGPYLVRHEIIALHTPNEPQIYPVCFQANLRSSGSAVPSETVRFPGVYTASNAWTTHNLYYRDDPAAYVPPGPEVYNAGAAAPPPAPAPSAAPEPSSAAPVPSLAPSPASSAAASSSAAAGGNSGETQPAPAVPAPSASTTPKKTCKRRRRRSVSRSRK